MSVDELLREVAALRARVDALEAASGLFATDKDLDGRYGDPKVRFNPKQWTGVDCKGKAFSECPPEFLDVLAGFLAWAAENPQTGKEKYAKGNALDAKRARGWARRIRSGWKPTVTPGFETDNGASAPAFPTGDFGSASAGFEAPVWDAGNAPATDPDDDLPF